MDALGAATRRTPRRAGTPTLLPIPDGLRPYLEAAIRLSPSDLVFPKPDGSMRARDLDVTAVLRRGMGHCSAFAARLSTSGPPRDCSRTCASSMSCACARRTWSHSPQIIGVVRQQPGGRAKGSG